MTDISLISLPWWECSGRRDAWRHPRRAALCCSSWCSGPVPWKHTISQFNAGLGCGSDPGEMKRPTSPKNPDQSQKKMGEPKIILFLERLTGSESEQEKNFIKLYKITAT